MTADILFSEINGNGGNLGIVTLNRPKVLNALSLPMLTAMYTKLQDWATDNTIKAVVVQGTGERAFCAGGDIRYFYDHGKDNFNQTIQYFWHEYRLDHAVFHFPKPYISLLQGITMGGGAGISINGSHRIAAENLVFAMPETGIGFYPDIGALYFLPRCFDHTGFYAGLTGEKISVNDAIYMNLIDAIVPEQHFEELKHALAATHFTDDGNSTVAKVIRTFSKPPEFSQLETYQATIAQCFSKNTVEEIIAALHYENSSWSNQIAAILMARSPTSLKVTLRALQQGAALDFDDCMRLSYQLTQHFLLNHDFYEGIRAAIIDKDRNPTWQPLTLVSVAATSINKYFTPGPANELKF